MNKVENKKKYLIPNYMDDIINNYNKDICDNGYFIFNRLLDAKEKNFNKRKNNNYMKVFNNIDLLQNKMNEFLKKDILNTMLNNIKKLNSFEFVEFNLKQEYRMVVGLGENSISETSMKLHYIYGIPYIPGQVLKGITKSYIINELFNGSEKEASNDKGFVYLFGSEQTKNSKAYSGKIVFFDSYPISDVNLKVDITNNHHMKYYQGISSTNDRENPNLVKFLTIENSSFKFIIGIKSLYNIKFDVSSKLYKKEIEGESTLCIAKYWLNNALMYNGVGAKTSIGYGYFL